MAHPEQKIIDFIAEHHILTLAVSRDNTPWCATCYYTWMKDHDRFIITSEDKTRHIRDVVEGNNWHVAGTIALETKIVGKIRGIQFTGVLNALDGEELKAARTAYLKRFPIARLMPELHLWSLVPDYIKMTDNRFGFGNKLVWKAEESMKSGHDAP